MTSNLPSDLEKSLSTDSRLKNDDPLEMDLPPGVMLVIGMLLGCAALGGLLAVVWLASG